MKSRHFIFLSVVTLLLTPFIVYAQETNTSKIEFTGTISVVEGQFIGGSYYYLRGPMTIRPWLSNEYSRLGMKATVNEHFKFIVVPQIRLWNDTWDWTYLGAKGTGDNPFNQHTTVSLADAEGIFSFGNKDLVACDIAAGVIPFKYNPDVKNLGEYLFRAGERPAYILTSFDQAYATLTGFRVNAELYRRLSADLFFTTETQVMPINDWSLSFLLGYKLPGYLDVGAGVMFDRLISVEKLLDKNDGGNGAPNTFYNSAGKLDSISWGGTKLMARLSIDPKGFLPSAISQVFGREDGKIYGEVAVLGLDSYTAYKHPPDSNTGLPDLNSIVVDSSMNFYSDIKQRIPVMFGFTIPTLKVLDYLSVELEWFGWPYSPSQFDYENFKWVLPKPLPQNYGKATLYTEDDNWKYSFNLKKTVWNSISLIGQISRDHTRHDVYFNGNLDVEEVLQQKKAWGWWLKLQYGF